MSTFRPRSRRDKTYDLLPPERPKPKLAAERLRRPPVVEDAEFVVISDIRPGNRRSGPSFSMVPPGNDNGAASPRPARPRTTVAPAQGPLSLFAIPEKALRRLSENMFSALVAMVFLLVFALTGGISALAMTGEAEVRPVIGISHVAVTPKTVDGLDVLLVSGVIENNSEVAIDSPRLRALVHAGGQLSASTLFRTRTGMIASGESRGFQVKLPHSGGKTAEVTLELAE